MTDLFTQSLEHHKAYHHLASRTPVLSGKHRAVVEDYTKAGYVRMNQLLRGQLNFNRYNPKHTRASSAIQHMASAFDQVHPTEHDLTLHRGIEDSHDTFGDVGSRIGHTFRDPGFTSTSTDPKGVESFAGLANPTYLHIHVPAGHRVLHVDKALSHTGDVWSGSGEQESILRPGSRFRIDQDYEEKSNAPDWVSGAPKSRHIHLTLLPHEET